MSYAMRNFVFAGLMATLLTLFGCASHTSMSPNTTTAALSEDGKSQLAKITVNHGYDPGTINIKAGVPTKLSLYRDESADSCAKEFEIPSLKIKADLPNRETKVVELPALKPGEIPFSCSMKMMNGKIVVQ